MSSKDTETINELLRIPDDTKYWFVRAGSKAEYYDDFAYNNYIAIGDSDITLKELKKIESNYRVTDEVLQKRYKKIFQDSFIKDYKSVHDTKKMDSDVVKKDLITITRSASISALKAYNFIEEMKVGDIVLVPNNGSSDFRIGVITSDTFSNNVNHIFIPSDEDATASAYNYSDYDKKRRVAWLKEITVKDLPDKLLWIKSGHKAIFDISDNAESINPLLSANYFYKNKFYTRIGVGTPNPISSTEWFTLQKVIVEAAPQIADQVFQKHKVESIGQVIIQTGMEHWDDILFIAGALFGQAGATIKGREYHINGLLTNFYPSVREQKRHDKEMNKHEEKKAKLEEESMEKDNALKDLEIQRQKRQLIESETKTATLDDIKDDYKLSKTDKDTLNNLNLSGDEVGDEIPSEMQEDSLNLSEEVPEPKKKQ